ncbi:MAG TPA: helix-turn-helix transcriptional regulator, partial [Casimicrobiaceae bacterium]|nr:helix-turn-helix transcriptional regulator [Casimicrobiaceae bacterium]
MFAVRDAHPVDVLDGLPELLVEGLPTADARLLLDAIVPGPLDADVKARILDEARGNPLALMELPRGVNPSKLAGGFGLPDSRPLTGRIERSFLQRVEVLPRDTQLLLLVAASEPLGDVGLLWRAASLLGIESEAGRPAEEAGLIEFDRHVRFVHPLVRSAVYRAFAASDRRDVRRALADATDPDRDPDRRAWHRAYATAVPDEDVAVEMVRSADRARARGGMAAAAAFLQRAAELTPDPTMRVERSLAAAQAKLVVADTGAAANLLETIGSAPLDDLQRARMERLRAEIVFLGRRGRDAPALLLQAARRLEPLDTRLARDTYLEGISSAMSAGRLGTGPDAREVAAAAALVDAIDPPRAADLLLDGLVTRFTEGYAASVVPLEAALRAIRDFDGQSEDLHWLWLSCRLATDLWNDELWFELATRGVRVARDRGALTLLPNALNHLAALNVHSGAFAAAAALCDEVRLIVRAAGFPPLDYARFKLATARGDRVAVQALIDGPIAGAATRGEGQAIGVQWALLATMHNGFGQYDKALAAARQACEYDEVTAYNTGLTELIEAGVRNGESDESAVALDRLRARTNASGTPWALGVEARSRALVHGDEAAYAESIEQLGRSRATVDLARSRLVYGEWLRRENRRVDARKQLRSAHESFTAMGADAFAERARRELLATGETARRGDVGNLNALTPQEWQVARLARDGFTNPEIGSQLFISARTVE